MNHNFPEFICTYFLQEIMYGGRFDPVTKLTKPAFEWPSKILQMLNFQTFEPKKNLNELKISSESYKKMHLAKSSLLFLQHVIIYFWHLTSTVSTL